MKFHQFWSHCMTTCWDHSVRDFSIDDFRRIRMRENAIPPLRLFCQPFENQERRCDKNCGNVKNFAGHWLYFISISFPLSFSFLSLSLSFSLSLFLSFLSFSSFFSDSFCLSLCLSLSSLSFVLSFLFLYLFLLFWICLFIIIFVILPPFCCSPVDVSLKFWPSLASLIFNNLTKLKNLPYSRQGSWVKNRHKRD